MCLICKYLCVYEIHLNLNKKNHMFFNLDPDDVIRKSIYGNSVS